MYCARQENSSIHIANIFAEVNICKGLITFRVMYSEKIIGSNKDVTRYTYLE